MRLGFMHSGKARPLREVRALRAHERLDGCFRSKPADLPRATLARWGVSVVVGQQTPHDHLATLVDQAGTEALSVEAVEGVVWIGQDLLLLRLAMVDLLTGEMFERWVVLDCARDEVEYLMHDLRSSKGERVRAIRSQDVSHLWLQCLRISNDGGALRQVESADGAVLELHRVPLSRLMSKPLGGVSLYGPLTCVYAPTAFMMTAGDRTHLAPGELALVDDVEAGSSGALSFVTLLGVREADGDDMQVLSLYELALDVEGQWRCTDLFGTLEDEQWMIL